MPLEERERMHVYEGRWGPMLSPQSTLGSVTAYHIFCCLTSEVGGVDRQSTHSSL